MSTIASVLKLKGAVERAQGTLKAGAEFTENAITNTIQKGKGVSCRADDTGGVYWLACISVCQTHGVLSPFSWGHASVPQVVSCWDRPLRLLWTRPRACSSCSAPKLARWLRMSSSRPRPSPTVGFWHLLLLFYACRLHGPGCLPGRDLCDDWLTIGWCAS